MRALMLVLPVGIGVVMFSRGGELAAPAPLLTGVSLLAGGMLSAFTHLSTLRLKITDINANESSDRFEAERGMLDETAAHLLTGSLFCALNAAVLVLGMNVSVSAKGHLTGVLAAMATGISSYIILLFVIVLPRLYFAYVEMNNVSVALNGFDRRKHE
ncbi:hypothetical protein ACFZDK_13855 [Streptomyces sp. NPDC007901]|uniref:hypothetical protein n=1 Tax=Streptomyces sp. NPDC007901 TaxID=3364785 RepID=UPI0036E34135